MGETAAEFVKLSRKKVGVTQEVLARNIDRPLSWVAAVESGRLCPTPEMWSPLAKGLQVEQVLVGAHMMADRYGCQMSPAWHFAATEVLLTRARKGIQ